MDDVDHWDSFAIAQVYYLDQIYHEDTAAFAHVYNAMLTMWTMGIMLHLPMLFSMLTMVMCFY